MTANKSREELRKELWIRAKKNQWDDLADNYGTYSGVTVLGETALHMAIANGQKDLVERLVKEKVEIETLRKKNTLGNTALHMAAQLGSVEMCESIVTRDTALLAERNNAEETPLFVAAIHGRKRAFLRMHGLMAGESEIEKENKYLVAKTRTALHAAIAGEHFDLAYQIIILHPNFKNQSDDWGFTPLHLLARMPTVFKSGYPMGHLHTLVYSCIPVKKLKNDTKSENSTGGVLTKPDEDPENPPNSAGGIKEEADEKNPPNSGTEEPCPKDSSRRFLSKAMDKIFWGLGSFEIGSTTKEKKKHTYSVQIMNALLENYNGENAHPSSDDRKDNNIPTKDEGEKEEAGVENKTDKLIQVVENKTDKLIQVLENKTDKLIQLTEENQKMIETIGSAYNIDVKKKKDKDLVIKNLLKESPLIMAAKNGILEMVEKILEQRPDEIHQVNIEEKNIVLAAVQHRQPHIYQFILDQTKILNNTSIFYKTDKDGNSALHLAAYVSDERNWAIPGPAMHMQWEIKWYQFVENSMPDKFFVKYNQSGETAWNIFRDTHKTLVVDADRWLNKISTSCSVVSVLIATVAFAAYAAVPGGFNQETGRPILERDTAYNWFAISSLIALCCSIFSVVMFLVFFTSKYREVDFARSIPTKVLLELTSLMVSVAALLVSFCAGHSYVIKDSLKHTAFILYAATLLPIVGYALFQVPQFLEMAIRTIRSTPQRIYSQ